jgi:hypothetical protein
MLRANGISQKIFFRVFLISGSILSSPHPSEPLKLSEAIIFSMTPHVANNNLFFFHVGACANEDLIRGMALVVNGRRIFVSFVR